MCNQPQDVKKPVRDPFFTKKGNIVCIAGYVGKYPFFQRIADAGDCAVINSDNGSMTIISGRLCGTCIPINEVPDFCVVLIYESIHEMCAIIAKSQPNDGGNAFPLSYTSHENLEAFPGMTLRQWYAGLAMQWICANDHTFWDSSSFQGNPDAIADVAIKCADALINAEKESR